MKTRVAIPSTGRDSLNLLLGDLEQVADAVDFEVEVYRSGVNGLSDADAIPRQGFAAAVKPAPIGYSSTRNAAIADAVDEKVDVLVLIDDDVRLVDGYLERLINACAEKDGPDLVAGHELRTSEVHSELHELLHPRTLEPTAAPTTLPSYMLGIRMSALPVGARLPEALDFTGGEDTALTGWLYGAGARLQQLSGVACTEEDSVERLAPAQLLFRRLANSSVLVLCKRAKTEPWAWHRGPERGKHLGDVLRRTFNVIGGASPRLAYQLARVLGKLLGHMKCVPVKHGDQWSFARMTTGSTS